MSRLWAAFLFLLAVVAFGGAALAMLLLPDQVAEFSREPEDVYLGIFWSIVSTLIGVFLVAAAIRSFRGRGHIRPAGYVASTVVGALGLLLTIMGFFSPVDRIWLVPAGLICIAAAGVYVFQSERVS